MTKLNVSDLLNEESSWRKYEGGKFKFDTDEKYFTFVTQGELAEGVDDLDLTPIPIEINDYLNFDDDNSRAKTPEEAIAYYRGFTEEEATAALKE